MVPVKFHAVDPRFLQFKRKFFPGLGGFLSFHARGLAPIRKFDAHGTPEVVS
jgi:hypothetical protein